MGFFVVAKEERSKKKLITGISEFVFFVQQLLLRDAHLFFKKCFAETPMFIVFFGCVFLGPSCQKREILDTHQKTNGLITEKLFFGVFLCFLFCLFLFLFFFFGGGVFFGEGLRVR